MCETSTPTADTLPRLSRSRGATRLLAILGLTSIMALPVLALSALGSHHRLTALRWYYRMMRAVLGLRLRVEGRQSDARPTLYASNHVSYLDVLVLGSVLNASFVSKSDIRSWPLVGFFARKVGTSFIERDPRFARQHVQHLRERLQRRDSLVLFPEGTATDGCDVIQFKSSLFAALPGESADTIPVQPVSVVYCGDHLGGPLSYRYRLRYAWTGEMPDEEFGQHAWDMLCSPGLSINVVLHPPLAAAEATDRKLIAAECEATIRAPVVAAVGARGQ